MGQTLLDRYGGHRRISIIFHYRDGTIGRLTARKAEGSPSRFRRVISARESSHEVNVYPTHLPDNRSYTFDFNSWIYSQKFIKDRITTEQSFNPQKERTWSVVRQFSGFQRVVESSTRTASASSAKNKTDFQLCAYFIPVHSDKYELSPIQHEGSHMSRNSSQSSFPPSYDEIVAEVQMEKDNMQGETSQASDKQENTIITRDEARTDSTPTDTTNLLSHVSTERYAQFEPIVNRWVTMPSIEVRTQFVAGQAIGVFVLPRDIFSVLSKTPNITPFESYLYSHLSCEMKFVVNANKFHCGKVICSTKFDSYKTEADQSGYMNALARPHIILDLSANNEGNLTVPFRFRRALMRNTTHENGTRAVRTTEYATVCVHMFSPLRTGSDGVNNMFIRPFVRFSSVDFAGMSYRAEVQMDVIRTVSKSKGLKGLLRDVESVLDFAGNINCDRPTDLKKNIVVPHARMNFSSGKGAIDAMVMRMNPTVMTPATHIKRYDNDPTDMLQIAQIWGLKNTFEWSAAAKEGTTLARLVVDPSSPVQSGRFSSVPTPVEYVCSMYNFWCGTMEMRLDFVSNAFHTGAIMVCVEFGRQTDITNPNLEEACSTYTQTFHLGDQKSLHVTIPYIYDTIWRRSTSLTYNPQMLEVESSNDSKRESMNVRPNPYTQVVIRVVNPLRPPDTVSQIIDVQVFLRASSQFRVHSLKQCSMYINNRLFTESKPMNSFPRDYVAATVARTQMDDGRKEDLDPTADFNLGLSNLEVQTRDEQTNIKDILRRPTLIILNQQVDSLEDDKTMGLFIPIMPPSRMMAHVADNNTIFSELVGQTPTAAIANMFRFWRGSSRYTIFARALDEDCPIYITHVPHTGTRIVGNQQIGNYTHAKFRPIYASGLTTEVIVPRVNPTATIEVPYDTTNNWTLMFENNPAENYTWRDKGDLNAGHIVISSQKACFVDVWWSAGDDFQVANFYGVPAVQWGEGDMSYTDEHAVTQMEDFRDFDVANLRSNISETFGRVTPASAAIAAAGAIPVVGPFISGLATSTAIHSMKKRAESSLDNADALMHDTSETLASIRDQINPIGDSIQEVVDLCKARLESMFDGLVDATRMSTDLLNSVVLSFYSKSYLPLATTLINFLKDFALSHIPLSKIQHWITQINYIITHQAARVAQTQAATDPTPTIVGVLIGIVGVLFNVQLDANKYESSVHGLGIKLTSAPTFTYLNGVLTYVQRIYVILMEAIKEALGIVDPEVAALRLITENSDFLRKFVAEAQLLTSDAMRDVRKTPRGRHRYFIMTLTALQIQRALIHAKGNPALVELSKFIAGVVKKTEEHRMDLSACPIKLVPFMFTIEGPSKIGKSYAVHDLLSHLHQTVGVKPSAAGLSYTYQSGSAHWNNYDNQHFILMDDYGQRTDPESLKAETDVLFNLCTDAPYTPPMAHLEDKRIYANPLGVILLTNDAYANHLVQKCHDKDAYLRRRGFVFRMEKKPQYEKVDIDDIDANVIANFDHLQVRMYQSPNKRGFFQKVLTYHEFKEYCGKLFANHYRKESAKQCKQLKELYEQINGAPVEKLNFQDPYQLFSEKQINDVIESGQGHVLIEDLQRQAAETIRIAEKSFTTIVEEYQNTRPENPFAQVQMDEQKVELGESTDTTTYIKAPSLRELFENPPRTWEEFKLLVFQVMMAGPMSMGALVQYLIGTVHNCERCKKYFGCAFKCQETNRYVCEACYIDEHKCPLCNKQHARVANSLRWLVLFAVALFIQNYGMKLLTLVPYIGPFFRFYRYVWIFTTALTAFVGYMSSDARDQADDYYLRREGPHSKVNLVRTQESDLPDPDILFQSEDIPPRNVKRNLVEVEPAVQNDAIEAMLGVFIDEKIPCRHCHLIENIASAIYVPGEYDSFKVPLAGTSGRACFINVPLNPCGDECPMNSEQTLKDFCETYVQNRKADIRALLTDYMNYPENRDDIRKQIPYFALPDWARTDDVTIPKSWWTWLTEKWSKYGTLIKIFGGVIAVLGVLIKLTAAFISPETEPSEYQYGSSFSGSSEKSYYPRTTQRTFVKGQRQKYTESVWANTQSETTTLMKETAAKIFRNQILIRVRTTEGVRSLGAVGVCGRNALLPLHYYWEMRKAAANNIPITIERIWARAGENNHTRHTYTFSESDFSKATDTDLAVFHLPASFDKFKDIRNLFATNRDMNQAKPSQGVLIVPNLSGEYDREVVRVDTDRPQACIRTMYKDQTIMTRHVIPYNFSESGACGAMLLISHPLRPIQSIHTCGIPNGPGFGVIVTQELLEEMISSPIAQMEETEYCEFEDVAPTIVYDDDVYLSYHGAVAQKERPFMQKKTKIEATPLRNNHGFTSTTEPAILDAGDERWKYPQTPLYHGVKKHGVPLVDFPTHDVLEVEQVIYDQLFAPMRPVIAGPQRLTPIEAVVGIPGMAFYDAMKLTTSAGYPWVKKRGETNKLAWIQPIVDKNLQIVDCKLDPELEVEIMRKEALRKKGIVPHTIFCDTLKDERRKFKKIASQNPTRVFCASPVDFTIAMRQNLLHFCAATMNNRLVNRIAVGLNPLGPEWSKLAHKLHSVTATNVFSLDYSNFGPGFHAVLGEAAFRIMARWTMANVADIDPVELETMGEEVINSLHIAQGTIYQQMSGSPSGAAVTAIINSIVNLLYLGLAWKKLAKDHAYTRRSELWSEFFNHTYIAVYGDDLIAAVSDEYIKVFNPQTVIQYLGEYGIVATDASKLEEAKVGLLTENTFLKRGFLQHPLHIGMWLAPLDWNVVEEIVQWKHKGLSLRDSMDATSYTALLEAHGHGKEAFDGFKNKLNKALRKIKVGVVQHSSWEDVDRLWFDDKLTTVAYSSLPPGVSVATMWDNSEIGFKYKEL